MPFKCPVCDNDEYDEADGVFYCTECQTQSQEYQVQECDEFNIDKSSYRHEVVSRKVSTKKGTNLGRPWTLYEAYQFVILAQADALIELGASSELKDTVYTLWANYLSKLGVAFSQRETIVPDVVTKLKTGRPREITRGSIVNPMNARKQLATEKYKRNKKDDVDVPDGKTAVQPDKFDGFNVPFINESRLINSEKEHKRTRHMALKSAEWMTIKKTIALCFLGLTFTNPEILPSDVVRWVYEGKVPLLSTSHLLADDMMLSSSDYSLFHVECFDVEVLLTDVNRLSGYLSLAHLPRPNLVALTLRFIKELNLPDEFCLFVQRLFDRLPYGQPLHKTKFRRSQEYCLGYIVLAFKMVFGIDDRSEVKMSKYTTELQDLLQTDVKLFNFSEWKDSITEEQKQTFDAFREVTSDITSSKLNELENVLQCYAASSQDKRRLSVKMHFLNSNRPVRHYDPEFREALARSLSTTLDRHGYSRKDKDCIEMRPKRSGETFKDSTVSHLVDLPAFEQKIGKLEKTKEAAYRGLIKKISSSTPKLVKYPFPKNAAEVLEGRHSNYSWLLDTLAQKYYCEVQVLDKMVVRLTEKLEKLYHKEDETELLGEHETGEMDDLFDI